jgi:hypothetical protein
MTGFQTSAEAVTEHGKLLATRLTDDLNKAVEASHISLGPDVMGVICQMYSFVFNKELDRAKDLVAALPKAMESTGRRLQESGATYDDVERGNAASFRGN